MIIINLILLISLIFILVKEHYPQRIIAKIFHKKKSNSYLENPKYQKEIDLYKYYHKKGNIVMLGNSITSRVDWNELLNRNDIINRGIDNDVTEGFINRIDSVIKINPKICFIMGGINDITKGVELLQIKSNIKKLINILQNSKIEPVVFSILYVANTYPDYLYVNKRVKQMNNLIEKECKKNSVAFIDINSKLGNNEILRKEYSFDGLHLTGLAYKKWGEIIMTYLDEKNNVGR